MQNVDEIARQAYCAICTLGYREDSRILFTALSMSVHCNFSVDTSKKCCEILERMLLVEKCNEHTAVYKVLYPSEIVRKKLDQLKH